MKKNKSSPFAQLEALRAKLPEKPASKMPAPAPRTQSTEPERSFADWINQVEPSESSARAREASSAPVFHISADRTLAHVRGEPEHLDALRRMSTASRIELHGLTRDQAEQAIASALGTARRNRERKLLIVHGKGEHSPKGIAVLRYEMANFLLGPEHAIYVLAYAPAEPREGGEGATVVLLR
jgi:DNA-nicking Smr family endonuclease